MGTHSGLPHVNKLGQVTDDWNFLAEVTVALPLVNKHGYMGTPHLHVKGGDWCQSAPIVSQRQGETMVSRGGSLCRGTDSNWRSASPSGGSHTVLKVKRPEPYPCFWGMSSTSKVNDNVSCLVHTYWDEGQIWVLYVGRPWGQPIDSWVMEPLVRLKPQ